MSLLVVVFLAAGAVVPGEEQDGLIEAAESALGGDAHVVVRSQGQPATDAATQATAEAMHADAYAVLTCATTACDQVNLRVSASTTAGPPLDRELEFASVDSPRERGRSIGFALASMVPARAPTSTGAPTPPEPPPTKTPDPKGGDVGPVEPERAERHPLRLELSWMSGGVGTQGGEANVRFGLSEAAFVGVGAGLREGEVEGVDARDTHYRVGALFSWERRSGVLAYGFRLDALAVREEVTYHPTATKSGRWVPAADVFFELALVFSEGFSLVGYVGPEASFGETKVTVGDSTVATLPAFRLAFGLGVRLAF